MGSHSTVVVKLLWIFAIYSKAEIVTEPPVELRWDFSSCGNVGRFGPTQDQCEEAYKDTNLHSNVTVEFGIQEWTVPISGLYLITAIAPSAIVDESRNPGRGAHLTGEFELKKGAKLDIIVGQHGTSLDETRLDQPAGGSGGTFVVQNVDNTTVTTLMVAGGASCGSGVNWDVGNVVADASLDTSGKNASVIGGDKGNGGIDGGGGTGGDIVTGADSAGGGGSGYFTDGERASFTPGALIGSRTPRPARSFQSVGYNHRGPGVGGYFTFHANGRKVEVNGGFGGGGSGSANGGCGGGGGYSGGGGGSLNGWGGGGGSINNGNRPRNVLSSERSGAVIISFIGHQCCGPVPVYVAATFVGGVLTALIIAYAVKKLLSAMTSFGENSDDSCSNRCLRKLKAAGDFSTAKGKTDTT